MQGIAAMLPSYQTERYMTEAKNLPEVLREKVAGTEAQREFTEKVNGKDVPMMEKSFAEKEIEMVHLEKIAPMFFYCSDNNKIVMIPFSVQFTVFEFLQLAAKMSGNLEQMLERMKPKEVGKTEERKD